MKEEMKNTQIIEIPEGTFEGKLSRTDTTLLRGFI